MIARRLGLVVLFASPLFFCHSAVGATNEWTKTSSGYWEEPFWSLGLPVFTNDLVAFRNAGFKALAIGANTTANYSNHLYLNYLTVDAPPGSANQLLLNYAGLSVPLFVNSDFILGTNASVVSYYSAVRGGSFHISGPATFSESSIVAFSVIRVGVEAAAALSLSNSSLSASLFIVAPASNTATVNQTGGSSLITNLQMKAGGAYHLTNGTLVATNIDLQSDTAVPGMARFTQAGGNVVISQLWMGARQFTVPNATGEYWLVGGSFQATDLLFINGTFQQTGGTNTTSRIELPLLDGDSEYFLSGGTLISSNLFLGSALPAGEGTFIQTGGIHTNDTMTFEGKANPGSVTIFGHYLLNGGLLVSGTAFVRGGDFKQAGGTNYTREVLVDEGGSYVLTGGELVSSNTALDVIPCVQSIFIQSNGSHRVQNRLSLEDFVRYELRAGSLTASNIHIGPGSQFMLFGGAISNAGTLVLRSGAFRAAGSTQQLGQLQVLGNAVFTCYSGQPIGATLDVGHGGGSSDTILRFRDSWDVPWSGAGLSILNWSGSTNGGGPDQIFIGTNSQGLTASQLNMITFVNPVGWPPGSYPARILSTGEIVPTLVPNLAFARAPDALILSWPGNYQLLSSTNVAGPYEPVPGATSPFTNSFVDPQRFFRLGLPPP